MSDRSNGQRPVSSADQNIDLNLELEVRNLREALRYCRAEAEQHKKTPAAWAPAVIDRVNAALREGPYER